MKTVCPKNNCVGCMACVELCPKNAIKIVDDLSSYNAVIDEEQCVNCNLCHNVCQNNADIEATRPISWKQGWALDSSVRESSSSGGAAQAIELAFVKAGGIVCSCTFSDGKFGFSFAETENEISAFCGSKYVKSAPYGVYKELRRKLQTGNKILFVGLPCQVAAVKKYVGEAYAKDLYTIDLICHGSPSPEILRIFLEQHGIQLNKLQNIQFRTNTRFQLKENERYIGAKGVLDRYSMAFLNGVCYTENCYKCQFAKLERCSDITLGDSWGSDLSKEEQKNGVSLILCQTEKGVNLVESAEMNLLDVDLQNAVEHNHQLKAPSQIPANRNAFFERLKNGGKFDSIVRQLYPKQCAKQFIKKILIKTKLSGGGKINYGIVVTLK